MAEGSEFLNASHAKVVLVHPEGCFHEVVKPQVCKLGGFGASSFTSIPDTHASKETFLVAYMQMCQEIPSKY